MLPTLLSRATRVVQEITRLGMEVGGLAVGEKLFDADGLEPIGEYVVNSGQITIKTFNAGNAKFVHMITKNGQQYVTTAQSKESISFYMKMPRVFDENDNIVVLTDSFDHSSFIFYKNAVQPPRFHGKTPTNVYHVGYDHRYETHTYEGATGRMHSTRHVWPKGQERGWIKGLAFTVSEYENGGKYSYCMDRDGCEYVATTDAPLAIHEDIKWKISSASMAEVTFNEDRDDVRAHYDIGFPARDDEINEKRAFKSLTFHLDHWSGKGFDAGASPRESFGVPTGRKRPYEDSPHDTNENRRVPGAYVSTAAYHKKIARYDDSNDTAGHEAVSERLDILKTFTAAGCDWVKQKGIKGKRFPRSWWLIPTAAGAADRLAEINVFTDGKTVVFRHAFNPQRKWQWYDIADADSARQAVAAAREVQRG